MSNFEKVQPPEQPPGEIPEIQTPEQILTAIAHQAAAIEAESRYLRVLVDSGLQANGHCEKITELDEDWLILNGLAAAIATDPTHNDHYQIAYTDFLLEAFRVVREAHVSNSRR